MIGSNPARTSAALPFVLCLLGLTACTPGDEAADPDPGPDLPPHIRLLPVPPSVDALLAVSAGKIVFARETGHTFRFDPATRAYEDMGSLPGRPLLIEELDGALHAFIDGAGSGIFRLSESGSWSRVGAHHLQYKVPFHSTSQGGISWTFVEGANSLRGWISHGDSLLPKQPLDPYPWGYGKNPGVPVLPSALRWLGANLYYAYGNAYDPQTTTDRLDNNLVMALDLETLLWWRPSPRKHARVVEADFVHEGNWYLLSEEGHLERYLPTGDKWEILARNRNHGAGWNWDRGYRSYFFPRGKSAYLVSKYDHYEGGARLLTNRYDIATDTWQPLDHLETASGAWSAVALDSKIYVVTGKHFLEIAYE
jgi:hypothetical protein